MRKIEEIEEQIQKLSREEFAELREWFLEQDWMAWDTQIEADANSRKLDKLVSEARQNMNRAGHGSFEALRDQCNQPQRLNCLDSAS